MELLAADGSTGPRDRAPSRVGLPVHEFDIVLFVKVRVLPKRSVDEKLYEKNPSFCYEVCDKKAFS